MTVDAAAFPVTGGPQIVLPASYAGIYVYGGSTGQSIDTGSIPILLTCFNTAAGSNGLYYDAVPVKISNKITINRDGVYKIFYTISYSSASSNVKWIFYTYSDGSQITSSGSSSTTVNAGDIQCVNGISFVNIASGKDVDLRGYHNQGISETITVNYCNFTVIRIGS